MSDSICTQHAPGGDRYAYNLLISNKPIVSAL